MATNSKNNRNCNGNACTQATTDLRFFMVKNHKRKLVRRSLCYTCYLDLVTKGVPLPAWEDAKRRNPTGMYVPPVLKPQFA